MVENEEGKPHFYIAPHDVTQLYKERVIWEKGISANQLTEYSKRIQARKQLMIRYYGYYSNKSRGMRKQADKEDDVPALIDSDLSTKEFRRNWARLIQKVAACPGPRIGSRAGFDPGRLIH